MRSLALSLTAVLVALIFVGCYTQVGYYEPSPRLAKKTSYTKSQEPSEKADKPAPTEEMEAEKEKEQAEDEGYYGQRKPTYRDYVPYYDDYYYYPTYPYDFYYAVPFYGYGYAPYHYYHYGYYPYGRYYDHYHYHYPYRTKIGDLDVGRQRPQSYRGVGSNRPASARPSRSPANNDANNAPASGASRLQYHELQRSQRRH
jgi:hypothetical protein